MRKANWCILITTLSIVLIGGGVSRAEAQLRVTEVLSAPASDWDGDGAVDSKLDEWVEVQNTGTTVVDLQNVFLRDGTGTAWHFGFSGTLEPGATRLVTGTMSLQWQADNDAGSSALSLNNSGDLIEVWRAPDGGVAVLVDSVIVPGHSAVADRAYAWSQPLGSWILHDGLNPYAGELVPTGTGCDPSPGLPNLCLTQVPTADSSVGRIKAVFER